MARTDKALANAVRSNTDECVLWPYARRSDNYGVIRRDGRQQKVHRIMCIMANGPAPKNKPLACHKCGVTLCFNPRHLYWGSHADNSNDMVRHGVTTKGDKNSTTKLTDEQVREIYLSEGSNAALGRKYGVHTNTIRAIRCGQTWRHVTGQLSRAA